VAYSYPFSPLQVGCQWQKDVEEQYIDAWGYTPIQAAAFFPATMIALDMREFMGKPQPVYPNVDISQPAYRAHVRYPEAGPRCLTDETPPVPSDACYRNDPPPGYIYIQGGHAHKMDLVIHEYSHRAHDALGGWSEDDVTGFPEGIADLIRGAKEFAIGKNSCDGSINRGGCHGRPGGYNGCAPPPRLEDLATAPYTTSQDIYAAWLFDIWDGPGQADLMPKAATLCPERNPPTYDNLIVDLGLLWSTFPTPYATSQPARDWVERWLNSHGGSSTWQENGQNWRSLLTVSVHHGVYTNCNSFPIPPPPP
jgi:hypothetical protein